MTAAGLRIRYLTFCGPDREPALMSFEAGLNVIYGASNTGKSFIVDAIDFMLGGKGPLRDIPERVGYDRILLAIETLDGQEFTVQRSTNGGTFKTIDTTSAGVTTFDDESAAAHTKYAYRIYAMSAGGKSSNSKVAKTTTAEASA